MSFPEFEFDRYFLPWFKDVNHSIFLSSYKTNMVLSIGLTNKKDADTTQNMLSIWRTNFSRPMGMAFSPDYQNFYVGSSIHLWKFANQGNFDSDKPELTDYDYSLTPRKLQVVNDIDIHDIVIGSQGEPYFVSALFSCICTPSDRDSFDVFWHPPWITKISAEDRCHFNGLCCRDGKPRYISSVAQTDIVHGWREHRKTGGVVYDILENKVVCKGLSMPHSPRWHDGKLWVLESGEGYLGYIDFDQPVVGEGSTTYKFERKAFIPGFLRGLSFIGNKYAVVGASQDRHENTFSGLGLGDTLKRQGIQSRCGVFIVDLKTFDVIHNLVFQQPLIEIYDIAVVPGVRRPHIVSLDEGELARKFSFKINGQKQLTTGTAKVGSGISPVLSVMQKPEETKEPKVSADIKTKIETKAIIETLAPTPLATTITTTPLVITPTSIPLATTPTSIPIATTVTTTTNQANTSESLVKTGDVQVEQVAGIRANSLVGTRFLGKPLKK